jgi:hypothetical protein
VSSDTAEGDELTLEKGLFKLLGLEYPIIGVILLDRYTAACQFLLELSLGFDSGASTEVKLEGNVDKPGKVVDENGATGILGRFPLSPSLEGEAATD